MRTMEHYSARKEMKSCHLAKGIAGRRCYERETGKAGEEDLPGKRGRWHKRCFKKPYDSQ